MTTSSWRFQGNERKYLEEVLASGFRAGADGAFTTRFEKAFANAYGVPYGVAFNSGTTTMHAALLAMGARGTRAFLEACVGLGVSGVCAS